jgi:hypothetical protein
LCIDKQVGRPNRHTINKYAVNLALLDKLLTIIQAWSELNYGINSGPRFFHLHQCMYNKYKAEK